MGRKSGFATQVKHVHVICFFSLVVHVTSLHLLRYTATTIVITCHTDGGVIDQNSSIATTQTMAQPVEQLIMGIPPVTRCWVVAAVGASLLVECQVIAPVQLYFSWKAAVGNMQLWRFITTFLYFRPLSLDLAFHLFFMMRYSRLLEENSFSNRRADYVWLLLLCASFCLVVSPLLTMPFLSSALAFSLVYIWSRRNPSIKMSLFGVITITAPYLPLCLVAFSWLLQGGFQAAVGDIVGILAGHTYVFLQDYWPREMWSTTGKGEVQTPVIVKRLFGQDLSRT